MTVGVMQQGHVAEGGHFVQVTGRGAATGAGAVVATDAHARGACCRQHLKEFTPGKAAHDCRLRKTFVIVRVE